MNRLKSLLPIVAFFPLLMAPSGGYPVNPVFNTVGIGGGGSCAPPNLFAVCAQSGQSATIELAGPAEVAGVSSLAIGQNSGNVTNITDRKSGDNFTIATTGTGQIQLTAGGGVTVNSFALPQTAVLSLASTTASAACTLNGSVSRNIASCSTNAGGTITTVTFTTAFSTAPACVISQNSGLGASVAAVVSAVPLPTTTGFTVAQSASPGPGYMVICST